ncbi:MAG: serine hydrolase domain-containing protein [Clostridia bacterium]
MIKETIIISGFPGIGKSKLYKEQGNYREKILELDSKAFSRLKNGDKNKNFVHQYLKKIKSNIGKVDVIIISQGQEVRQALDESNISYILVYPDKSLKNEYIKRYIAQGRTEEFVKRVSRDFEDWVKEIENYSGVKFKLNENEHLKDILLVKNILHLKDECRNIKNVDVEKVKDILLKNLIKNKKQGYALYFKTPYFKIEEYNGEELANAGFKIDGNTNFRLASVSKQFIAYAVLLLIDKGKIKLETKLTDIFAELPLFFSDITIQNLLNNTSGLPDYEEMEHDTTQIKDYEIVTFLKENLKLYFKPGTDYRYSNTGYVLLGLIIEKITKNSLSLFLKTEVFDKLRMYKSTVNIQGKTYVIKRAFGHVILNDKFVLKDQGITTATIGDGGIYSSVNDLKKWLEFIQNNEKIQHTMLKPNVLPNGKNTEYGYGIRVQKHKSFTIINHKGETVGTNTEMGFIKEAGVEFIFLTNMDNIPTEKIVENIKKLIDLKYIVKEEKNENK